MACSYCNKKGTSILPVCKGCQSACYCNRECQRRAWPTHKQYCKKVGEQGSALAILPSELLFEVFRHLGKESIVFFRACKRLSDLRSQVLRLQCLSMNPFYHSLLRANVWRMDFRLLLGLYTWRKLESGGRYYKFKKIVLKFIIKKNCSTLHYECRNSYHRRLVHQFCDLHDLEHTTIDTGRRKECRMQCIRNGSLLDRRFCLCGKWRETVKVIVIKKKDSHLFIQSS